MGKRFVSRRKTRGKKRLYEFHTDCYDCSFISENCAGNLDNIAVAVAIDGVEDKVCWAKIVLNRKMSRYMRYGHKRKRQGNRMAM